MMSGNLIIVESHLEGSVSSSSKRGMKSRSHSFPSTSGGYESGIIVLNDDLEIKGFPEESLLDEAFSTST